MPKVKKDKMVKISAHDYAMLKRRAERWTLMMAVVRNSARWADKYGDNVRGDLCRGIVKFVLPLLEGVGQTLDEHPPPVPVPKEQRAWDLVCVQYFRHQEEQRKGE